MKPRQIFGLVFLAGYVFALVRWPLDTLKVTGVFTLASAATLAFIMCLENRWKFWDRS